MTLTAALGIITVSLLSGLVLQSGLSPVPLLPPTALVALVFSTLMSYALMPALTGLHRWRYPRRNGERTTVRHRLHGSP
ncbi:hypothetical protein ACFW6E_43730 [Streptomyces olivaceoviridis]|uniref:hypothetical protein n=1 Tax=Streptomyces olivaceoviridis TaxID=1921 RepID=UPI0036C2F92E